MKDCSEWVTLRVTNWSAYDHTLVRRGSLMIGLDVRLLRERWCRPGRASAMRRFDTPIWLFKRC